jgi:FPC/CPF motif-containing protein YcgG
MSQTHPRDALENSCYGRFQDGDLLVGDGPASSLTSEIHSAFRAFLHDPAFPCLGARSLVNQRSYRFGLYRRLSEPSSTAGLAVDLRRFVEEMPSSEGDFSSFIACFLEPKVQSLKQFEGLRDAIRERDTKLHGTVNPMLSDYGAHSEARQYAGRQVGPHWKCPVHFGSDEGGER